MYFQPNTLLHTVSLLEETSKSKPPRNSLCPALQPTASVILLRTQLLQVVSCWRVACAGVCISLSVSLSLSLSLALVSAHGFTQDMHEAIKGSDQP